MDVLKSWANCLISVSPDLSIVPFLKKKVELTTCQPHSRFPIWTWSAWCTIPCQSLEKNPIPTSGPVGGYPLGPLSAAEAQRCGGSPAAPFWSNCRSGSVDSWRRCSSPLPPDRPCGFEASGELSGTYLVPVLSRGTQHQNAQNAVFLGISHWWF